MLDLLVVGGGPAGAATAIHAARAGLSVRVLEPRAAPIDKACGEGLMPGGARMLADELGVRLGDASGDGVVDRADRADTAGITGRTGATDTAGITGVPFRGIRYTDGRSGATALFASGPGLGVRRTDLSRALHARLDELGVPVVPERATAVEPGTDRIRVNGRTARWLVAADGLHSPIRRRVGLDLPVSGHSRDSRRSRDSERGDRRAPRWGLRRHFATTPWADLVEVHWAERSEAYVTPVPGGVGVAILTSDREPFDRQLARFPALRHRLDGAEPASRVRGAGPFPRRARGRVAGRALLVGDAAGYVDALTGEGLSVAFAEARELVRCLVEGDREARDYERSWRRVTRTYRTLTGGLLWARRRSLLAPRIVPAAARLPGVFTRAVHALAD